MTNGAVVYFGPSLLEPLANVAVVITGLSRPSDNAKTGAMLQSWILQDDTDPVTAVRAGLDWPVCGDCPLASGEGCYVNVGQAPLGIWRGLKRGIYPTASNLELLGAGRAMRLGAYGDPAAVPVSVWQRLTDYARQWTGYTHQWRTASLQRFCMASVESHADAIRATARGYRTFRLTREREALDGVEIVCPALAGRQCVDCGLCQGSVQARSITIPVHGSRASRALAVIT